MFLILIVPFVLPYFFFPEQGAVQDIETFKSSVNWMMIISIPWGVALYTWIWVLGRVCNAGLPSHLRRSGKVFNVAMPLALCYIPVAMLVFPQIVFAGGEHWLTAIIIPIHIVVSLLAFYSILYSARRVASLGSDRMPGFGRTLLVLLGIVYFPIGIWFIQPRLNAAFEELQQ